MKRRQIIGFIFISFCFLLSTTNTFAQKNDSKLNEKFDFRTVKTTDYAPNLYLYEAKGGVKLFIDNAKVTTIRVYNPDGTMKLSRTVRGSSTSFINTRYWEPINYHLEVILNDVFVHEYTIRGGAKFQRPGSY